MEDSGAGGFCIHLNSGCPASNLSPQPSPLWKGRKARGEGNGTNLGHLVNALALALVGGGGRHFFKT